MREFARTVTDPEVLSEIYAMIEEWELRARYTTMETPQAAKRPESR